MKYQCTVCGQIIDNGETCPICGSDHSKIIEIGDEKEESTTYRCLSCGRVFENKDMCPFCGGEELYDLTHDKMFNRNDAKRAGSGLTQEILTNFMSEPTEKEEEKFEDKSIDLTKITKEEPKVEEPLPPVEEHKMDEDISKNEEILVESGVKEETEEIDPLFSQMYDEKEENKEVIQESLFDDSLMNESPFDDEEKEKVSEEKTSNEEEVEVNEEPLFEEETEKTEELSDENEVEIVEETEIAGEEKVEEANTEENLSTEEVSSKDESFDTKTVKLEDLKPEEEHHCCHHHDHKDGECCCEHHEDEESEEAHDDLDEKDEEIVESHHCCHHHEESEEQEEEECCCGHHHEGHEHEEGECCCGHHHSEEEYLESAKFDRVDIIKEIIIKLLKENNSDNAEINKYLDILEKLDGLSEYTIDELKELKVKYDNYIFEYEKTPLNGYMVYLDEEDK